ncbi:RNA polymerase sigma factor [Saliterribacillus persicus]|uniref:RNA polymerase sigma factor n=1 Tax=Saliterribacillus persicus TaxID=930114 RepID=A0A368Y9K0_9BACI|nr:sigma-70 family RNA polymerase sigma factor [Saliterribacillus persicus]RCW76882.1 RNA polymerase sigma-70 factor (ECF subfamily) [Saliterribacillus persicus]
MSSHDLELYSQIQAGDQRALEQLYDRYEKLVYSFAYRMVKQEALAEEIVQEVFMKIWTKKGVYQEKKGKLSSWILTITRNTSIDIIRKNKITTHTFEEWDSLKSDQTETEDIVLWKEKKEKLKIAVRELSEDQQQIVQLFYFKGFSQQKIANTCSIPLGTVKGRIRLALKHLKETMKNIDERGVNDETRGV